jgi:hypothetical protein
VSNLEGDVWLNGGRWVAKFVAHLLATAALWVPIETFSKIQNGRHKTQEWTTHSCPQKNIYSIFTDPQHRHKSIIYCTVLTIPGQPLTSPSDLCATDLKIQ